MTKKVEKGQTFNRFHLRLPTPPHRLSRASRRTVDSCSGSPPRHGGTGAFWSARCRWDRWCCFLCFSLEVPRSSGSTKSWIDWGIELIFQNWDWSIFWEGIPMIWSTTTLKSKKSHEIDTSYTGSHGFYHESVRICLFLIFFAEVSLRPRFFQLHQKRILKIDTLSQTTSHLHFARRWVRGVWSRLGDWGWQHGLGVDCMSPLLVESIFIIIIIIMKKAWIQKSVLKFQC